MSKLQDKEPTDPGHAIVWNLAKSDWHDHQATLAEAMDCADLCPFHDQEIAKHKARIAEIEAASSPAIVAQAYTDYEMLCAAGAMEEGE